MFHRFETQKRQFALCFQRDYYPVAFGCATENSHDLLMFLTYF